MEPLRRRSMPGTSDRRPDPPRQWSVWLHTYKEPVRQTCHGPHGESEDRTDNTL